MPEAYNEKRQFEAVKRELTNVVMGKMENLTSMEILFNQSSVYDDMGNGSAHYGEVSFTKAVSTFLYTYVLPVIVFVGLFGNLISIYLILADRQMRNVSSSTHLLAVLLSDTGMLFCLFLVWMEALGFRFNHHPAICRINVYLTYVCGFLSIWYVVCITVETFITICHPTKIKQMCTLFRARIVSIVLLLTASLLYIVVPIITKVQYMYTGNYTMVAYCLTLSEYAAVMSVVSYIDTVLTLIVPLGLLIVLLTLILLAIIRSIRNKKKRSIKKTTENGGCGPSTGQLPQVRVAKMLFILSCSVLVLNMPSHVMRVAMLILGMEILQETESIIFLVFLLISYCSFSAKFFICMACSQNFRKLFANHLGVCTRTREYTSVPQQTMITETAT